MKPKPLTKVMLAALAFARANGGKLHRHAGGYWTRPEPMSFRNHKRNVDYFGTQTINSLIARGLVAAETTRRYGSPFHVRVTVIEPAPHPSGLSGEHDVVLDAIASECLHQ